MTTFQINTFTGSIQNQSIQLINARELHQRLEISTRFQDWILRRINDYKFTENLDFIVVLKFENVDRGFFGKREIEVKDYHLTLDMAKELCMLERSELGRQARRYFIEQEKKAVQLAAENAKLLASIPPFLLNNPDRTLRLVEKAQTALFMAYPECKEIVRYRDMGLNNGEIGKLVGLSRKALEIRLRKLFDLGVLERKQLIVPKQLALGLQG